jgi:hypothetical protein
VSLGIHAFRPEVCAVLGSNPKTLPKAKQFDLKANKRNFQYKIKFFQWETLLKTKRKLSVQ